MVWAAICARFGRTRDEATQCGLTARWHALVEATRRGESRIEDWNELTSDIAELQDEEEDFATRGPFMAAARVDADIDASGGFGCPGQLCGRRVAKSALGGAPRCELLREDMAGLGS